MKNKEMNNKIKNIEWELTNLFNYNFKKADGHIYIENKLERMDTIQGIKIIIYPNDHGYPHFHLKANNPTINCKIKISDLTFIQGEDQLSAKNMKALKTWYNNEFLKTGKTGKEKLEEIWMLYHLNLS